jgi:hypothetical protein
MWISLIRGNDQKWIDANPYVRSVLTVLALPSREGDQIAIRLELDFADEKRLDMVLSAPVVTAPQCVRG